MVKKIALEEHFLCPGFEDYWKTTSATSIPTILGGLVGRLTDFGEQRLEAMDRAGIVRAVLSLVRPRRAESSATPRRRVRKARECQRLSGARNPEAARSLFRLRASRRCRTPRAAADRARTLHARSQILRRDDQRPHQRPISRSSRRSIRSGSARRRWARRSICIRPIRSRRCPALDGLPRAAPRHLGMAIRDRLARVAPRVRRHFDRFPARQARARPPRRDAAVPALALRQPRQALRREAREAAVGIHPATISW